MEKNQVKEMKVFSLPAILTIVVNCHPKVGSNWMRLCEMQELKDLCKFLLGDDALLGFDDLDVLFMLQDMEQKIFAQIPELKEQFTGEIIGKYIDDLRSGNDEGAIEFMVQIKRIMKIRNKTIASFLEDMNCSDIVLTKDKQ